MCSYISDGPGDETSKAEEPDLPADLDWLEELSEWVFLHFGNHENACVNPSSCYLCVHCKHNNNKLKCMFLSLCLLNVCYIIYLNTCRHSVNKILYHLRSLF